MDSIWIVFCSLPLVQQCFTDSIATIMSEDTQLQNLDRLLKNWANNITEATKEIISSAIQGKNQDNFNSYNGSNVQIFDDIRDRQSRVISVSIGDGVECFSIPNFPIYSDYSRGT